MVSLLILMIKHSFYILHSQTNMKHLKTINEGQQTEFDFMVGPKMVDERELVDQIDDIIGNCIEIVDEPYSRADVPEKRMDYQSRKLAALEIVKYLKELKLIKTE